MPAANTPFRHEGQLGLRGVVTAVVGLKLYHRLLEGNFVCRVMSQIEMPKPNASTAGSNSPAGFRN